MGAFQRADQTNSFDQEDLSKEELNARNFAKSLLLSRIFVATYLENRYVQSLNEYRDVIRIHDDEKDLLQTLSIVKKRIESQYRNCWVGITETDMVGAPVGTCLWVELDSNKTFGRFWFKIRSIKFKLNEVIIRVKVLRDADSLDQGANVKSQGNLAAPLTTEEIKEKCLEALKNFSEHLRNSLQEVVTIQNTKDGVVYMCALMVTILIGGMQFLQYLGDYSLKLFRELSILMKNATPFLIALMNTLSTVICAFFQLIYYLFRGPNKRNYNQIYYAAAGENRRSIQAPYYDRRGLTYQRPSGVQITELN